MKSKSGLAFLVLVLGIGMVLMGCDDLLGSDDDDNGSTQGENGNGGFGTQIALLDFVGAAPGTWYVELYEHSGDGYTDYWGEFSLGYWASDNLRAVISAEYLDYWDDDIGGNDVQVFM